jgi:hypothetical protein
MRRVRSKRPAAVVPAGHDLDSFPPAGKGWTMTDDRPFEDKMCRAANGAARMLVAR